jgi:hypothetical protein
MEDEEHKKVVVDKTEINHNDRTGTGPSTGVIIAIVVLVLLVLFFLFGGISLFNGGGASGGTTNVKVQTPNATGQ